MKNKKIIHCDADCFFAALEMRDDPSLVGIPMAVGGDPFKRGVISTCNYEARAFGVRAALASAYAKRLCPQLIIVPHNMQKYKEAAQQLKDIFLDYTDIIEPLSLDEAFLDVSEVSDFSGSATLIAEDIRRRVYKEVGITVSAGVAPNKFLAKVASDWKKPNGLTVVEPSRVKFFLKTLPIACVPGVGPQTLKKIESLGIRTCGDVLPFTEVELVTHLGVLGKRLYALARGDDHRPVRVSRERKSMSVEHTFENDRTIGQSMECLSPLLTKLRSRLNELRAKELPIQAQEYQCLTEKNSKYAIRKVFVKITFADFSKTTIEMVSPELSLTLLKKLLKTGGLRGENKIRLLGLGVRFLASDNDETNIRQLDLFGLKTPP